MKKYIRQAAVLAFAISTGACLAGLADPARAIVYSGTPDLKLTVDLVTAGTGPSGFSTKKLFATMYGDRMPAEARRLEKMFGPLPVANFFTLMDFSINDVLAMVKRENIALPAASSPLNPQQLDQGLVAAGTVAEGHGTGRYDVGYMIDRLISHQNHHLLMVDLFKKYPGAEVASFHTVLGQVIKDSVPQGTAQR